MLIKKQRLKKENIPRVLKKGRVFSSENIYIKVVFEQTDVAFAFVVSKKVSKKAVVRNKIKRRAREATKMAIKNRNNKKGVSVVVFLKPGVLSKTFKEIQNELLCLYKKAKIV